LGISTRLPIADPLPSAAFANVLLLTLVKAVFTEISGLAAQTFHNVIVNDNAKISRIRARNSANLSHLDPAGEGFWLFASVEYLARV
jgi:hypothetical protein